MKKTGLIIFLFIIQLVNIGFLPAQNISGQERSCFYMAKQGLEDMLTGKEPLSYEQAIVLTENAYWGNSADIERFRHTIDFHAAHIRAMTDAARDYSNFNFNNTFFETEEQKKLWYEEALINKSIFSYITDTIFFIKGQELFYRAPFSYSKQDPFGTSDWSNTQVFNLLDTKQGNCFALASLFKILSERLNTGVSICTAPGHIYLRHADPEGIYYNVEPATRSFPGSGSMEVLTFTTGEAVANGISLRELDLKQSVALCLVYLAKGYEYKFNTKEDKFLLECAEVALRHDSLNLNAMLLKAGVLEERIIRKKEGIARLQTDNDFKEYEKWLGYIHSLGYREMPTDMKNIILAGLKDSVPFAVRDKTPQPFKHLGVENDRYATLSWGLFEEFDYDKPVEQYGRTLFDSRQKKITGFTEIPPLYNSYNFDPVVFAWQIDPLAYKYPNMSPYAAFNNNPILFIDTDGREPRWGQLGSLNSILGEIKKALNANDVNNAIIGTKLSVMSNYFATDRKFIREKNGKLKDIDSNKNIDRYIYTEKSGWIDMHHFFKLAEVTKEYGQKVAELYAYNSERYQYWNDNPSGWSYEDIASDMAGIEFWLQYGKDLTNGKTTLLKAVENFFTNLGATDPMESPNCEFIPHVINPKYVLKSSNKKGLKGEILRNRHKEIFDNRTEEDKQRINDAHETILD